MPSDHIPGAGGCACGEIRYKMTSAPLFVHCCHCTWCQRETGSAFALNAMIETDRVELLNGKPALINTPSNSGKGQIIARCPNCCVAVWSHYSGAGNNIAFVRVGTLDNPNACPPDIHIYTSTKQAWVELPDDVPAVSGFYSRNEYWPAASCERREATLA